MKRLYVYPEKCTGCRECSLACSLTKFGECNPKKAAISVVRDEFNRYELPIICYQCDDPVCHKFCHQNAYFIKDGVVLHNEDKCVGCRLCAVLCPYNAITTLNSEIIKCDLCDGDPQCVKYCSTQAIQYLEETDELEKRRKKMAEHFLAINKK
ncbi:MAG: 4Fe-4S dicluster domain-containing protein [Candidatus Thermoplasmatota archaeon]|nr:4Fe-4S dicluster domain-containing protein [Candidatus Thermoplasmatota archaeon]MBU1940436.1 4Fe-4S dicluster domain-containing protein [Candidatus Thermoplasmatota archaeon]